MVTSYASHPVTHLEKHVIPGRTYTEVHPQVRVVEQPYVHQVGEQVHNVPTGVSYQSSSVVHSKKVVTPVLAHGVKKHVVEAEPIIKTYQEPSIVKTVATQQHVAVPVSYAAPAVSYAAPALTTYAAHAPVYAKTIAAPVSVGYAHSAPVVKSVWGNTADYVHAAPLATKTVLASPYVASPYVASPYVASPLAYKTVAASPYSYGYGLNAAHAW